MQGVTDRLCAWESELATEAKATRAHCPSCKGCNLMPVTQFSDRADRTVRWWCTQCSRFRTWEVCTADYAGLPFCPDGIPRVPPGARETLRGAITAADFEFVLGQLPNNRAQLHYTVRTMRASPCPPPPHNAAAPMPPPRRCSSCNNVSARRLPLIPIG